MSVLSDGLTSLIQACDEAKGTTQYVLIDGQKKRAIVEEITADDAFISGGIAQAGGFRVKCRVADFAEPPERFAPIEVRGTALVILSVNDRNGVEYEITAGDPSNENG